MSSDLPQERQQALALNRSGVGRQTRRGTQSSRSISGRRYRHAQSRRNEAIAEADECSKQNEPIPHEQVLTEFGLSMDDWEKMRREP
jgi:hypothetical protein